MEYCSLGDLSHYIKQAKTNKTMKKGSTGGLSERVVRHFLKQLANALQFLRSQDLIHRDIKPQNLLLAPNPNDPELPILKVADFGFARFLPDASLADTLCGSPLYMGPEILSYRKYDAKADLWSVGAVLYETVTGKPPFRAQNHIELLKKINENNDKIHFPDPTTGEDLQDLIRKLLKRNPIERISFEDFFQHPAIQTRRIPRPMRTPSHDYEPPPFAQLSPSRHGFVRSAVYSKMESKPVKEDDLTQEYIIVDPRSIKTNQFADELDASPKSNQGAGKRLSTLISGSPIRTHAVNIPQAPPSTPPPFIRERKQSTGSSAGSALARAMSLASVRLFGTSMPSPPKDLAGSPRGFMSSHPRTRGTLQHIEGVACMAHAVAKFGDQKFEAIGTEDETHQSAEESVMLYVKALALLEAGLDVAQNYWQKNYEQLEEKKEMARLNDAVQWMREKFNECLDRAETIQSDKHCLENNCVEKLLYDHALEMSRQAAMNELVGENIAHCEQEYQSAIWLLEAILHVRPKDDVTIEEEDKKIITKFIDSIRNRITILRRKLEVSERV
ncbi:kinase-like domain-containing protein [Sporodiniella umbellata]|nr:kinase-like domain-containing protein [Sporodiniella umbellata]